MWLVRSPARRSAHPRDTACHTASPSARESAPNQPIPAALGMAANAGANDDLGQSWTGLDIAEPREAGQESDLDGRGDA
ncbi:hypothetical protein GCM10023196_079490 [Actinoallomurus vinaceus]|uniref:Uncharacterized protein n=1 Tax=Actinoallomurus vinaceus TaxID=1080074 RepID=A0ABP8UN25_9ACTN